MDLQGVLSTGYLFCHYLGERWAVSSHNAPQDRTFWVRFPVVSLEIFMWHIPSVRHQYPLGSTQPLTEKSTMGVKFGRRLGLTTLPSWCAVSSWCAVPSWCAECQSKAGIQTFHHRSESSWLFYGKALPFTCQYHFTNDNAFGLICQSVSNRLRKLQLLWTTQFSID